MVRDLSARYDMYDLSTISFHPNKLLPTLLHGIAQA